METILTDPIIGIIQESDVDEDILNKCQEFLDQLEKELNSVGFTPSSELSFIKSELIGMMLEDNDDSWEEEDDEDDED